MNRPNRKLSETGPEQIVHDDEYNYTLRQVGWIGQTGDFYTLDEDPSPSEPGSFQPLLIIAHSDRNEYTCSLVHPHPGDCQNVSLSVKKV